MSTEFVINSENETEMRERMNELRALMLAKKKKYVINVTGLTKQGSSAQRRYYHACIVEPFRKFRADQGEIFTHDQVHYDLKRRYRQRVPVMDLLTGEIVGERMKAWDEMDAAEGEPSAYVDLCIEFLTSDVGLIIEDPNRWYDRPAKKAA